MFDYFLEEAKFGHALVIPHDSVENSFAELVKTKKPSKRKPFHHVTDLDLNDWSIAISEMSIEHVSAKTFTLGKYKA